MLFENAVLKLAQEEFDLHPQANLRDYYKLFFQGTFGPGHFISDIISAIDLIYQELNSSQGFENHFYQKINYRQTFYRVNLVVMKMKFVSLNEFYPGFLTSSKYESNISMEQWINEWQQIERILRKSSLNIQNFEKDSKNLQLLFSNNEFVISHSEQYRKTYNPHYRLFNQTEFKNLNIKGNSCSSYIY